MNKALISLPNVTVSKELSLYFFDLCYFFLTCKIPASKTSFKGLRNKTNTQICQALTPSALVPRLVDISPQLGGGWTVGNPESKPINMPITTVIITNVDNRVQQGSTTDAIEAGWIGKADTNLFFVSTQVREGSTKNQQ